MCEGRVRAPPAASVPGSADLTHCAHTFPPTAAKLTWRRCGRSWLLLRRDPGLCLLRGDPWNVNCTRVSPLLEVVVVLCRAGADARDLALRLPRCGAFAAQADACAQRPAPGACELFASARTTPSACTHGGGPRGWPGTVLSWASRHPMAICDHSQCTDISLQCSAYNLDLATWITRVAGGATRHHPAQSSGLLEDRHAHSALIEPRGRSVAC